VQAYREVMTIAGQPGHTVRRRPVVRVLVLTFVSLIALAGCSSPGIDSIVAKFVYAGGTCATSMPLEESRAVAAVACDDGARLYLFTGDDQRSTFVKSELESNADIRARTHIMLSGENWLIIDRIAVIVKVMPSLHGIIQGRNGANP
jgi:hypothetical protein